MNFDEYSQLLQVEEFTDVLGIEGAIFGETKLNLELEELVKSLQSHQEKFKQAKGACICLSKDLSEFESDAMMQIYSLVDGIETYFIKKNPALKTEENLYSYSVILSGL
jgi:hypothetical protein